MKKINISKETVGKVAKNCANIAVFGLAMILPHVTEKNVATVKYRIGKADYSDAVGAIMGSDMFDSYKNEAINLLKKEDTTEYYSAVIQVMNSDMFDSYKVDSIRKINEK